MDFIDTKFISSISGKLEKFKKVNNTLYNFRCPICGDSKKNKNKARGYFYSVKNNTNYKCHNCGVNISFNNFLKKISPEDHKKYCLEKFKSNNTGKNFVVDEPKFVFKKPVFKTKINLPRASQNKKSKEFLEGRKLDPDSFYYAENFKEWVNSIKKTFDNIVYDEPRVVIPLYYNKTLVGIQGRSLNHSPIKYITIMLSESGPKIYGLDEIDLSRPVYITEGPFDSTFIENSIAMCGSDCDITQLNIKDRVWVYDNEPRNKEILSKIEKRIDENEKVVIYPANIKEKDINEMVMSGLNVKTMLESNTFSGLEAKLNFTKWKKV